MLTAVSTIGMGQERTADQIKGVAGTVRSVDKVSCHVFTAGTSATAASAVV